MTAVQDNRFEDEAQMVGLDERSIRLEAMRLVMSADVRTNRPIVAAAAIARFILTGEIAANDGERPAE